MHAAPASLLAREVAELHREKTEFLEENASLKKGLEFLLGRYFSRGDCSSCPFIHRPSFPERPTTSLPGSTFAAGQTAY
jgi:hypothetical protein